jgi:hypothetical protein
VTVVSTEQPQVLAQERQFDENRRRNVCSIRNVDIDHGRLEDVENI